MAAGSLLGDVGSPRAVCLLYPAPSLRVDTVLAASVGPSRDLLMIAPQATVAFL